MPDTPPPIEAVPPVLLVPILEATQRATGRRYAAKAVALVTELSAENRAIVRDYVVDTMARGIAMLAAIEAVAVDEVSGA
jgi:hypothetical protein